MDQCWEETNSMKTIDADNLMPGRNLLIRLIEFKDSDKQTKVVVEYCLSEMA